MAPDTDNGRVTMAVLGQKMDTVLEDTKEIKTCVKSNEDRIRDIELEQARNQVQHKYLMWGQGVFTVALTAFRTKISEITGLG